MLPSKVDPFTCAVRSDVDDHDKPVPLRCVTGPPELVDSVHPARSVAPTPRGAPSQLHAPTCLPSQQPQSTTVSHARFVEKPSCFPVFNPRSKAVQNNYKSALFLFTLDPVFSRTSAHSPKSI